MLNLLVEPDRSALERSFGGTLSAVSLIRRGPRARVFRATLDVGAHSQHVIVKQPAAPGGWLRHEAAGLDALQGLRVPALRCTLPSGALVIEDVGPLQTLDGPLGASPSVAEVALLRVAEALGELHAAARGRRALYARLDQARASGHGEPSLQLARAEPAVARFFEVAGVVLPSAFSRAYERLVHTLEVPAEELCTITLGDLAPSNVLLRESGEPVFIDLEYCAVRHAFYDAMFWRCICPFPAAIAERMEQRYLGALSAAAGIALDEGRCAADMVALATQRMLWMLSWDMQAFFHEDRDWVRPGLSARGMLVRYLEDYVGFAQPRPHEIALVDALARLRDVLRARWPESHVEPFPAFR